MIYTSCFSQFFPDQHEWLGVRVFEVNFVFSFKKLLQNQWKEAKKSLMISGNFLTHENQVQKEYHQWDS